MSISKYINTSKISGYREPVKQFTTSSGEKVDNPLATVGGGVIRTGGSSGGSSSGGGSGSQPTVYSSSLLGGQTFSSQVDMQIAEGKFRSEQAAKAQQQLDASGGLVSIGGGQTQSAFRNIPQTRKQTVEDEIRNTGVTSVTKQTAIKSLEQQMGRKLNLRELRDYVPIEEERLSSIAMTPEQRERATTYGQVMTGIAGSLAAPVVFGTGLLGTLVAGTAKAYTTMVAAVPTSAAIYDFVSPSPLTFEQRRQLGKEVGKRTEQRVGVEGINLPFVDAETEKQFTSAFIPMGDGAIGIGNIIYDLPGGRLTTLPKAVQEGENVLVEMGYSRTEAKRIAGIEIGREFGAKSFGEIGAFAFAGQAVGEIAGRATQKGISVFTKVGTKTLTKGQATIYGGLSGLFGGGVGGAVETAVMFPEFKRSRYEDFTPQEYVGAVAVGGISAGIAGGVIGGLTTRQSLQRGTYGFLGALEAGQEFTGDWAADKFVGGAFDVGLNIKGMGIQEASTASVRTFNVLNIFNPSPTQTQSFADTPTRTSRAGEGMTMTDVFVPTRVPTDTLTIVTTPSRTSTFTPTIVSTPTQSIVPTNANTITDALTVTQTPTQTETPTQTVVPTMTQTLTPTSTLTFVPTITAPFLPLVPPLSFGDGGFGTGRGRSRKKYYDELAAAQAVGSNFNFGIPAQGVRPRKGYTPGALFNPQPAPLPTQRKSKGLAIDFEELIFKPRAVRKKRRR